MMNPTIGLVVALKAEAGALIGKGPWQRAEGCLFRRSLLNETDNTHLMVACSGMGSENGVAASRWLIREGVVALGVAGVSGGLDPRLVPGDLILADTVIQEEGGRFEQVWKVGAGFVETAYGSFVAQGLPAYRGPIVTVRRPVLSTWNKESLFRESKALAVDMESAAVASVARTAGLPFFVLRAVCDAASRSISEDLCHCMNQKGHPRLFHLLRMVLLHPAMISELRFMKRDFGAALAGIGQGWRRAFRDTLVALPPPNGVTGQ